MDDGSGAVELEGPVGAEGESEAGPGSELADRIESTLDAVEAALGRLEEGTYGRCDVCGGPLGEQRLLDDPTARHCDDHLPLLLG